MGVFSILELEYLGDQRLGRLAAVGPDGAPHVVPVSFSYNGSLDTIDIGGHALADSKKWRDIERDPRVAFVVDDLLPPWRPRMVEIRGQASRLGDAGASLGPGFADDLIRIIPTRIVSFGLDGTRDLNARNVGSVADQP